MSFMSEIKHPQLAAILKNFIFFHRKENDHLMVLIQVPVELKIDFLIHSVSHRKAFEHIIQPK